MALNLCPEGRAGVAQAGDGEERSSYGKEVQRNGVVLEHEVRKGTAEMRQEGGSRALS